MHLSDEWGLTPLWVSRAESQLTGGLGRVASDSQAVDMKHNYLEGLLRDPSDRQAGISKSHETADATGWKKRNAKFKVY